LTIFVIFFFISVVVASCGNKYYGSNFISAVPTSLLITPGLQTIQFLFLSLLPNCRNWSPNYSVLVFLNPVDCVGKGDAEGLGATKPPTFVEFFF
jgi:hypothetical protein